MDLRLYGRRALVTGSSGGIGAGIAARLAAEGAAVLVHGRRPEAVQEVVDQIRAAGGRAEPALGDLGTETGAAQVVDAALTRGVDILVNNAGWYANTTWEQATPEDWLRTYNRNVVTAVRLIRALVPGMRERGWGRVVQIASGEATAPFPTMPDYAAGKAALVNLTVSLAKRLDRTGVTVNTVSPGIVVTPGVEQFYRKVAADRGWGDSWPDIEEAVLREVLDNPTGRLGRPADVADLVAYLVSPLAGYVNGANLRVDGGSTATVN
ncbi:MAG: short-chain dehydrogenase [Actinobacteria bacterium 13_2_20CM_2_71_6]|nr:MAG: short-chain dehydrogenase [Actinobacteria bacterium 13_2_20CM_2_71_6]